MPRVVTLRVAEETEPEKSKSYSFDLNVITIGREAGSNLPLVDSKNLLSRKHARIEYRQNQFQIIDSSVNGTFIGDRRLDPGKWYPLENGAVIKMGNYQILFDAREETAPETSLFEGGLKTHVYKDLAREARTLFGAIDAAYARALAGGHEEATAAVREAMDAGLRGREPEDAAEICVLLRAFCKKEKAQWAAMALAVGAGAHALQWLHEQHMAEAAYGALVQLKYRLLEYNQAFQNAAEIEAFCGKIDAVLEISFRTFIEAMNGRAQFEDEFGLEPKTASQAGLSALLARKSVKGLASLVLALHRPPGQSDGPPAFEQAQRELMLHQLAVLAGYKSAIRGGSGHLLEQLSPLRCLQQARSRLCFRVGTFVFKYAVWPLTQLFGWRVYQQVHDQWCMQNARDLLARYMPHFKQGYLEFLNTRAAGVRLPGAAKAEKNGRG